MRHEKERKEGTMGEISGGIGRKIGFIGRSAWKKNISRGII